MPGLLADVIFQVVTITLELFEGEQSHVARVLEFQNNMTVLQSTTVDIEFLERRNECDLNPADYRLEGSVTMTAGVVVGTSADGQERFTLFFGRLPIFSNFYYSPFTLDGNSWFNTEQYFQYKKAEYFNDEEAMKKILCAHTPDEQKKLGRKVKNYNENEWAKIREAVMLNGTIAKFQQNVKERLELFKTIGTELAEASWFDLIWGIGLGLRDAKAFDRKQWKGQNLLGKVIMQCRTQLALMPEYENEVDQCTMHTLRQWLNNNCPCYLCVSNKQS